MTLVDSNVLLDLLRNDLVWRPWSVAQLDAAVDRGDLFVNAVVYAEIAPAFADADAADVFLHKSNVTLQPLPRAALFIAGMTHQKYRRRDGKSERILPDFLIGAHAQELGCPLLTRDPRRYRTDFPKVRLITP